MGRRRCRALRAPGVHRHGVARVALDASRHRDGRRHAVAHDSRPAAVGRGSGSARDYSLARPRRRHARAARVRRRRRGGDAASCSGPRSCCSATRSRRGSGAGDRAGVDTARDLESRRASSRRYARTTASRRRWRRPSATLGRDFVAEPPAAPVRDGLRQHLASLPGRADRSRTPGWLGVPHGRRCGRSSRRRTAKTLL